MKRFKTFGWLNLLRGALFILLGIAALGAPNLAISGLVVFFGLMALLSGGMDIAFYVRMRKYTLFVSKAPLYGGIVSALAGLLLLLNPVIGKWVLNVIFPVWFIAHCISRIAGYGLMKRLAGKAAAILMVCLNVAGLLLGVLLIFNPMLFTISFGLLIAVSILLLGLSCVVEAFSRMGAPDREDW